MATAHVDGQQSYTRVLSGLVSPRSECLGELLFHCRLKGAP